MALSPPPACPERTGPAARACALTALLAAALLAGCVSGPATNGTHSTTSAAKGAYAGAWTLYVKLEYGTGATPCGGGGGGDEAGFPVNVLKDGTIQFQAPDGDPTHVLKFGSIAASGAVTMIDNSLASGVTMDGQGHRTECPAGAGTGTCSSATHCQGKMPDKYGNVYSWRMEKEQHVTPGASPYAGAWDLFLTYHVAPMQGCPDHNSAGNNLGSEMAVGTLVIDASGHADMGGTSQEDPGGHFAIDASGHITFAMDATSTPAGSCPGGGGAGNCNASGCDLDVTANGANLHFRLARTAAGFAFAGDWDLYLNFTKVSSVRDCGPKEWNFETYVGVMHVGADGKAQDDKGIYTFDSGGHVTYSFAFATACSGTGSGTCAAAGCEIDVPLEGNGNLHIRLVRHSGNPPADDPYADNPQGGNPYAGTWNLYVTWTVPASSPDCGAATPQAENFVGTVTIDGSGHGRDQKGNYEIDANGHATYTNEEGTNEATFCPASTGSGACMNDVCQIDVEVNGGQLHLRLGRAAGDNPYAGQWDMTATVTRTGICSGSTLGEQAHAYDFTVQADGSFYFPGEKPDLGTVGNVSATGAVLFTDSDTSGLGTCQVMHGSGTCSTTSACSGTMGRGGIDFTWTMQRNGTTAPPPPPPPPPPPTDCQATPTAIPDNGFASRASLPDGRDQFAYAAVGGNILVAGGLDPASHEVATLYSYSPACDAWTVKAPMPEARYLGDGAVEYGGKMYVFGGWTHSPGLPHNNVFVYDPATDTWAQKAPMPYLSACGASVVLGSKIYVTTACNGYSGYRNLLAIYDPATDSWTTGPDSAFAHSAPATAVLNGKWYLFGGGDEGGPATHAEVYDPTTNAWTTLAPLPEARQASLTANDSSDKIAVGGGEGPAGAMATTSYMYHVSANAWEPRDDPGTPSVRASQGQALIDGNRFIFAGHNGATVYSDMQAAHFT